GPPRGVVGVAGFHAGGARAPGLARGLDLQEAPVVVVGAGGAQRRGRAGGGAPAVAIERAGGGGAVAHDAVGPVLHGLNETVEAVVVHGGDLDAAGDVGGGDLQGVGVGVGVQLAGVGEVPVLAHHHGADEGVAAGVVVPGVGLLEDLVPGDADEVVGGVPH